MVSYEDLLSELSTVTAPKAPDGYKSIAELCEIWGVSNAKCRKILHAAAQQDRLLSKRIQVPRIDGILKTVSVFMVKGKKVRK